MIDIRNTIPTSDRERFGAGALELAEIARTQLRALCRSGFTVKQKPDGSFVTSADFEVEQRLRAEIQRRFPSHGIVGEEFPAHLPEAEFQWILDPVDGTEDFVQRIPTFGTIIALHYRGEPLAGVIDMPLLEMCVHATYGGGTFHNREQLRLVDLDSSVPPAKVRLMLSARANFVRHRDDGAVFDALTRSYPNQRIYRTCYAHACAAAGQADATVDYGNRIWDLAASRLLVEEAGGAYRVIQHLATPTGAVLGAVFGRPSVVDKVAAIVNGLAPVAPLTDQLL